MTAERRARSLRAAAAVGRVSGLLFRLADMGACDAGGVAGGVALVLYAGAHYGVPGDTCRCPVARYLEAHGVLYPVVDGAHATFIAEPPQPGKVGEFRRVPLPRSVGAFIEAFDEGDFSGLVDVGG